jgi:hypothetical protein
MIGDIEAAHQLDKEVSSSINTVVIEDSEASLHLAKGVSPSLLSVICVKGLYLTIGDSFYVGDFEH